MRRDADKLRPCPAALKNLKISEKPREYGYAFDRERMKEEGLTVQVFRQEELHSQPRLISFDLATTVLDHLWHVRNFCELAEGLRDDIFLSYMPPCTSSSEPQERRVCARK
jgi:hypothetical protein